MSRPRVLVARSGERPFLDGGGSRRVDVVERVTHDTEAVELPASSPRDPVDLAIFTSRVAVAHAFGGRSGPELRRRVNHARFASVGEATAAALAQAGYPPGIVGGGSGEALLSALPERLDGVRILWPCGEDASRSLAGALESRGATVVRCVVYRKVARPPEASLGVEILNRTFAAFCPTSPAAGRWLFQSAGVDGEEPLRATPGVALGEATAAFLRASGVRRIAIAARPRFTEALALLEALACPPAGK